MTSKITHQGRIVAAKRLNNSVNGNPRFDITFLFSGSDRAGEYDIFTTSSDAACSYDVENVQRSGEEVVIGMTRAGRVETISRLEEDALPTIIDYQVEQDDSAISVEWSSGKVEDVSPETVLKWLAAGERASR